MKKAIINARIYDYNNYIKRGFVIFDETILKVGEMADFVDEGFEIINAHNMLLLPNLVCAHTHIYSIFARGLSLPFNPTNFQDILDQMWWKIDRYIDNETTYYSGIVAAYEFLLNGVTTIIDHHASGIDIIGSLNALSKSVCDIASLRGLFCFETSDRYDVSKCIEENSLGIPKSTHQASLFGLHASMSLSNDTLKLVKNNLGERPIHIHVAESKMDEEDSINKYGCSVVERLNKFELLKDDSLIVHGVHLSENEIDILSKKHIYTVVNPTSNMNNAVGIASVKAYIDKGIPVLVGNDGLSCNITNEYVNTLFINHLKEQSPLGLGLADIQKMINNAYEYVGKRLNIKIGKLKEGYVADFSLLPYIAPTAINKDNVFGHIFYGLFNSYKPKDVFVDGKILVKNYKIVSKPLLKEYKYAHLVANKLWKRIKKGE